MYIGKTIDSIAQRWQGHLSDSRNPQRNHRHLYKAINKYGESNFTIESIEEVIDVNNLEEREKYWIDYYDTYHNGYNETKGGDGKHYLDYDLIYRTYQELGSCKAVAEKLNIDAGHVGTILKAMNVVITRGRNKKIPEPKSINTNTKKIDMYDLNNNYICTFDSIKEASQWCINNNYTKAKLKSVYSNIMRCLHGDIKYSHKHIWKYNNN